MILRCSDSDRAIRALLERYPAARDIEITGAAAGIALGHLLTVDSIGPAMGGLTALLALVGGTFFPVTHGFLQDVGQCLPSYWLAQAGHIGPGGAVWGLTGWLVMAAWTVGLSALASYAYRRDTGRV